MLCVDNFWGSVYTLRVNIQFFFMIESFFHWILDFLAHGDVFHVLLILLASSWLMGQLFKYFRLPMVLGDILAGVMLSPLFLLLFDNASAEEVVKILAEMGVFFMMLHSGMDTNLKDLSSHFKSSVFIALAGIIPISATLFIAFQIFLDLHFLSNLFLSLVLCINSIPVLVSFLQHHNLKKEKFGHLVIGSTMANELLLFFILSLIIIFAEQGEITITGVIFIILKLCFFVGFTLALKYFALPKMRQVFNQTKKKAFTFTMIVGLLFGLMAELIGLHIIIGAYLAGMLVREQIQNEFIFKKIEDRLYGIAYSFLGPIFFVAVGMSISLEGIMSHTFLFLFTFLVVLGLQVLGSGLMAYFLYPKYFNAKTSSALALTLGGRGGTEIIVAQIGASTVVASTGTALLSGEHLSFVVLIAFFSTLIIPFILRVLLKNNTLRSGVKTSEE